MKIIVTRDGQETDITEEVKICYDTAVGSKDFGSGFLDSEEVAGLRLLASACGFAQEDYPHDKCATCGHDCEHHMIKKRCYCSVGGDWSYRNTDLAQCPCTEYVRPEM